MCSLTNSRETKKKRHPDSHRSTVTTQTQNKTRQNYYAIFLLCRGGIFTSLYIFAYLQVAIRRFAYIKHSDFYFVHERRSKNVISSPCNLSGSLPSAIWRVPDDWNSSPTDADRTYSGYYPTPQRRKREWYGKVRISYARLLCRKSLGWVDAYHILTQTYLSYYSPIVCCLLFYSNNRKRHPFVFPYYGCRYE